MSSSLKSNKKSNKNLCSCLFMTKRVSLWHRTTTKECHIEYHNTTASISIFKFSRFYNPSLLLVKMCTFIASLTFLSQTALLCKLSIYIMSCTQFISESSLLKKKHRNFHPIHTKEKFEIKTPIRDLLGFWLVK